MMGFLIRRLRRAALPLLILLGGVLASVFVATQIDRTEDARTRARFESIAASTLQDLENKSATQITLLRGLAGFFNAAGDVDRDAFRTYVTRLRLAQNYSGVLGLGFAEAAEGSAGIARIEARGRAEHGAGFRLWPAGTRDIYSAILFLEPLGRRNQTALGYDMASEPVRHAAMLRARTTGLTAMSGKVQLVQEIGTDKQPGFLLYTPLYRDPVGRTGFYGWVYSPVRAHDLFSSTFRSGAADHVSIAVYDGAPSPANLLYQSAPDAEPDTLRTTRALQQAGRTLTLTVTATPDFARQSFLLSPLYVGLGGVIMTLLVAALAWQQSRAAGRIEHEVRERTAELARANQQLRDAAAAREHAETQLRHMQRIESLGRMTGGIAHDFNNMLAVIIGSLDLARRRIADQAAVARLIEQASSGASRAAELTQRLLAFSRQQSLVPRVLDPNRLVQDMTDLLARTLGETVTLRTSLAPEPLRLHADAAQLESAIVNLAVNARDAMPRGGTLTIGTARRAAPPATLDVPPAPAGWVEICVTDTGSGMTADVLDRAFDPFFTTKGVGRGTGLGLSQVLGYARQSGGDVTIDTREGEGTTICIFLPAYAGSEGLAETAARGEVPSGRPEDILLVVEDDDQVRIMTVQLLRDLGYTALHASGGADALDMLDRHPGVKLVFSDVVMPDMDGPTLAAEVHRRWPEIGVLFTTGYAPERLFEGRSLGEVALLRKPFTEADLAHAIREALDAPAPPTPGSRPPESSRRS
ncbi:CHASE domain-containing protein [Sphingomonas xinjiangensis]|uniref:histidine kinase n=1 Tax=Sphingomonas xinjiangensis TaxID=643568 RepID=A0A840YM27_9SPHN|nr:CHASE domain-containing protein [Sphingomonas xinjiangensis]MBB5710500.1 signal transduction histidine kinase/CheY-like chemotaxis protein [Sphingomonas xinjiangensis]